MKKKKRQLLSPTLKCETLVFWNANKTPTQSTNVSTSSLDGGVSCVYVHIKSTLTAATHKFATKTLILDDLNFFFFFFEIESPGTEYSKNQVNLQCSLDH